MEKVICLIWKVLLRRCIKRNYYFATKKK